MTFGLLDGSSALNDGFESILGLYSIIIGLGASKLLEGVKDHIVSRQTLRGNTLYVGMLAIGLLVHVTSWLSLWTLRDVENWGVWSFLMIMAIPLVLYLYSAITVPDDPPSANMNAYYSRNSTKMHGLLIAAIGFNALSDFLMLGRLPDTKLTVVRLATVALLLACALNPGATRLHRIIVPLVVFSLALLVPFMDFPIK